MLVASLLLESSFAAAGFRETCRRWAAVAATVLVAATAGLWCSVPRTQARSTVAASGSAQSVAAKARRRSEFLASRVFGFTFVAYSLYFFASMVPYNLGPSLALRAGVPQKYVVFALSGGAIIGRPSAGALAKPARVGIKQMTVSTMLGSAVMLLALPVCLHARDGAPAVLLASSFGYAACHSGRASLMPTMMSHLFDHELMPVAYGYCCFGMALMALGAFPLIVYIRDGHGAFPAFSCASTALVAAAALITKADDARAKRDEEAARLIDDEV